MLGPETGYKGPFVPKLKTNINMSFFRLIGILFGLFQEQAQGRVPLDELPIGNGPEQDAEVLERAQRDAQRAIQEEKQENWRLARFFWFRAAARFRVNSDLFVLYLMNGEKAANKGVDPPKWR